MPLRKDTLLCAFGAVALFFHQLWRRIFLTPGTVLTVNGRKIFFEEDED